jgi:hypothetical protein
MSFTKSRKLLAYTVSSRKSIYMYVTCHAMFQVVGLTGLPPAAILPTQESMRVEPPAAPSVCRLSRRVVCRRSTSGGCSAGRRWSSMNSSGVRNEKYGRPTGPECLPTFPTSRLPTRPPQCSAFRLDVSSNFPLRRSKSLPTVHCKKPTGCRRSLQFVDSVRVASMMISQQICIIRSDRKQASE